MENLTKEQPIELSNLGFTLAHIGINAQSEEEAANVAKTFCLLFGFEYKPGAGSIFAGTAVEVLKTPYLGKNGHIAIKTNSVEKAIKYIENTGCVVDMNTAKRDDNGNILAVYLNQEIGGFAVHLLQAK